MRHRYKLGVEFPQTFIVFTFLKSDLVETMNNSGFRFMTFCVTQAACEQSAVDIKQEGSAAWQLASRMVSALDTTNVSRAAVALSKTQAHSLHSVTHRLWCKFLIASKGSGTWGHFGRFCLKKLYMYILYSSLFYEDMVHLTLYILNARVAHGIYIKYSFPVIFITKLIVPTI